MNTHSALRAATLGLGLLGLGLGIAQVFFPRAAARAAPRRLDEATTRLLGVASVAAGAGLVAASSRLSPRERGRAVDYSARSGFPASPEAMRGRAADFEVPPDFRTPEALRPVRRDLH